MTLKYRVEPADLHGHRFGVTLTIPDPAAEQVVSLPVWAPGSYLVREFARHVIGLSAEQGGQALAVEPLDKSSWCVRAPRRGKLTLRYELHAFDRSVRTAFLDASRGFFNGPALLLRVHGREHRACELALTGLPRGWKVATSMPAVAGRRATWSAPDYDALIDHPFEMGTPWRGNFRAGGVDFEFVVSGAWPGFDAERLLADTRRLCAAQIALWHGRAQPPFKRYVFMLHAVDDGYGGLEHRHSTALFAARRDLPRVEDKERSDGYVGLLGLISHEFFHSWNVMRLRPREFLRLDYTRENYTRLLWFFEGVTSYYDDLMLLRAGLIDAPRYLKLLAKTLNGVLAAPGRQVQSVAQASFDAWIKFYRSDENSPNATVNYYSKGALLALALDLTLRGAGASLDDTMRLLWQRHVETGVTEADVGQALADAAGRSLAAELQDWVHGTGDLPLQTLLAAAGVTWRDQAAGLAASLGLRLSEGVVSGVQVKQVLRGSAAEAAGVAPGDELLAVDGWRIRRFDDARQWTRPGAALELLLARDQRILRCRVVAPAAAATTVVLGMDSATPPSAVRTAWLGA